MNKEEACEYHECEPDDLCQCFRCGSWEPYEAMRTIGEELYCPLCQDD